MDKEFLSKEIVLKLYRDLRHADSSTRIQALENYIETIKDQYNETEIQFQLTKQIGVIYFEGQEYDKAIEYLEKANEVTNLEISQPNKRLIRILLIRTNRLLKRYEKSLQWIDKELYSLSENDSAFDLLNILGEYADLCQDSSLLFDSKYENLIPRVVQELGFPLMKLQPIEYINKLRELNKFWNVELGKIHLQKIPNEEKIRIYQKYLTECEIKWYRDYVNSVIASLDKKSP